MIDFNNNIYLGVASPDMERDLSNYYTKAQTRALVDTKQDIITGAATTITEDNLTANRAVISNASGKVAVSNVTSTELGYLSGVTSAVQTQLNNKASTSLDNLSADGQMIIDSQNGTISNCVLEIPQNLKLEFSNGALTVKAGSVLVNSGEPYSTVTLTSDATLALSPQQNTNYMVFMYAASAFTVKRMSDQICSGDTDALAGTPYHTWFDTSSKIIKNYGSNTSPEAYTQVRYPICVLKTNSSGNAWEGFAKDSNGNDMIFNGAGFVGHHAFVYPNVKGLKPKGFNEDGSLASNEWTNSSLQIIELQNFAHNIMVRISGAVARNYYQNIADAPDDNTSVQTAYDPNNNQMYYRANGTLNWASEKGNYINLIDYTYDGTIVTDFTIRQPVRLATTEMTDKIQSQVDTNTTAIAGKQDTLVSGTNIKTINSTTVLGNGNFTLADQSLSNLDNDGQMIIDSQNGTISNCVLEIPQNLKMEISGSNVIVKAGSIGVRPGSTYQTYTFNSDYSYDYSTTSDGTYFFMVRVFSGGPTNIGQPINKTVSGATDSLAGTTYHTWFDTTNLQIKRYGPDLNTPDTASMYPFAIINVENGVPTFAKDSNGNDMIFNGAGFIGHHAFIYPNIKGLIANGFNSNGTLNSISIKRTALSIIELDNNTPTFNGYTRALYIAINGTIAKSYYTFNNVPKLTDLVNNSNYYGYVDEINSVAHYSSEDYVPLSRLYLLSFHCTDDVVDDFTIRQPYQGARNLLTDDVDEHVKQNTTDISTKQADLTTVSGYDATTTQVLKHVNGVLTWITEE